jgi:hypothetical protein
VGAPLIRDVFEARLRRRLRAAAGAIPALFDELDDVPAPPPTAQLGATPGGGPSWRWVGRGLSTEAAQTVQFRAELGWQVVGLAGRAGGY